MSSLIPTLNAYSQPWLALVATTVVQSTILAVLVAAVALCLRRSSPAVRYWLWQIVAVRLLIVPFWAVSLTVPWLAADPSREKIETATSAGAAEPVAAAEVDDDSRRPTAKIAPPVAEPTLIARLTWQSWLFVAWAAMVCGQLIRLGVQRRRLSRLLAATTQAPASLLATAADIASRLGISRRPRVRLSQSECSPFVCGVWRATLVVPQSLAAVDPAELAPVVAHELAHVKRRDLLWGWTAELARMLYFFHPVAYWAGYHIRLERELACDQLALLHGGRGPAEYAATLVRVLSAASEPGIFRANVAAGLDGGNVHEA